MTGFPDGEVDEGPPPIPQGARVNPTFQSTFKSREELDAFLAVVGLEVFKLAVSCSVMGWESPRGAVPYMHLEKPSPVWDLVLWTIGSDKAAKERMHAVGAEWAPALMHAFADELLGQIPLGGASE